MTTRAETFFENLCAEPQPLLAKTKGTLRFDVTDDGTVECWNVDISRGDVAVTHDDASEAADAVVGVDRALFDDIVAGRANAMAAVLRGELAIDGRVDLLVVFQRLFPGPPDARGPRRAEP